TPQASFGWSASAPPSAPITLDRCASLTVTVCRATPPSRRTGRSRRRRAGHDAGTSPTLPADGARPAVTHVREARQVLDGVGGRHGGRPAGAVAVLRAPRVGGRPRQPGLGDGGLRAELPDQPALDLAPDRQEPAVGRGRSVLGDVGA